MAQLYQEGGAWPFGSTSEVTLKTFDELIAAAGTSKPNAVASYRNFVTKMKGVFNGDPVDANLDSELQTLQDIGNRIRTVEEDDTEVKEPSKAPAVVAAPAAAASLESEGKTAEEEKPKAAANPGDASLESEGKTAEVDEEDEEDEEDEVDEAANSAAPAAAAAAPPPPAAPAAAAIMGDPRGLADSLGKGENSQDQAEAARNAAAGTAFVAAAGQAAAAPAAAAAVPANDGLPAPDAAVTENAPPPPPPPPPPASENGGKRKTRHQTPKHRRSAKKGRKGLSKKKTGSRK